METLELGQLSVLTEGMTQVDELLYNRKGPDGRLEESLAILTWPQFTVVEHQVVSWRFNTTTGEVQRKTEERKFRLEDPERRFYKIDQRRRAEYQARQNAERREWRLRARAELTAEIQAAAGLAQDGRLIEVAERRSEFAWALNLAETVGLRQDGLAAAAVS